MNLKELFSLYAAGKSSKKEKRIIDTWFSEVERVSERKPDFNKMHNAKEEAWEELLNKQLNRPRKHTKYRSIIIYGGMAAAIALLITLSLPILKNDLTNTTTTDLVAQSEISQQFITDKKMKRITLTDGSVVHMNMGTSLSLHKGKFNAHTREIWLDEGEAFFEVTKDPSRPFIVHTADGLSTQVLGTSFNIRAYRELGEQVVSVKTGRVQVSNEENGMKVLLDPDNNALFDSAKGTLTAGVSSGADAADWRNGRIVLSNAQISEVALRLKQYYNVDIANPEKVSSRAIVHFSFTTDMPLKDVLRVLADIYQTEYKIKDNKIIFI